MTLLGSPTHKGPVSKEEEPGERIEGDIGARALSVVVGAAELSTSGGETTAGDEGVGHSGPESDSRVHLEEG